MTGTFFGGRPAPQLAWWQIAIVVALAAVVLPLVANPYQLQVAGLVAIYATLALGLTLLAGTAGQVSLGQAGFLAIGAYASALLTTDQGWPFWPALLAAGLIAALLGPIVVAPALRLRGHYVAIATLGIGAMVVAVILNWEALTHGPLGVFAIPPPTFFGRELVEPRETYALAGSVLLVCAALVWRLQRSHLGMAWRGIREDEIAARSVGVDLVGDKALAFSLGAFVSGLAGSLLAHQFTFISPDVFAFQVSLLALTIVVLGGMSSILGTLLGAAVLVAAPELFRGLEDYRILAYGLVLLLLVRFRPQGLLGVR